MNSSVVAKILVVDDNLDTLRLLRDLFRDQNFDVITADSAAAAWQALNENPEISLVLSDISMPGESGFDLLRRIKAPESPFNELPVVLTTAEIPEPESRVLGLQLGAVDYVVRPIMLDELALRVALAFENFQRLRSLQSSLDDQQQLAQVGRVLAANSHEMKNLAAIIAMASRLLHRQDQLPPAQVANLLQSIEKSSEMLTNMTKLGRILLSEEPVSLRSLEVRRLTAETLDILGPKLKSVFIDDQSSTSDAWVLGNDTLIKQILINFILNSLESIEDAEPIAGGQIEIRVTNEDQYLCISIIDNGIGLAGEKTIDEFSAFKSTKTLRGGQGLGLWYCSNAATKMGGYLRLSSKGPGQGATALLRLPKAEAEAKLDIEKYLS
jgi:signal transduction histidine kinase